MTNFAIARRFAGLTGVALAEKLGVTKQQISAWESGARTPSRTNVTEIAAALDADPAWLLGVEQRLPVVDPQTGDVYVCGIIRTEAIPDYGALYHVYLEETGDILPVILAGDVQMTPFDWQTINVHCAADIPEVAWRDARNVDAVMVDGLPRLLV